MTDAYHKARRQFGVLSALLLSWEYVGIAPASEELKVKVPPFETGFVVKHPEVIPIVLLVLVVYSGIRYAIEWRRCGIEERKLPSSKVDFFLAYGIGIAAVTLLGFQQLYVGRDLAEVFTPLVAAIALSSALVSVVALSFLLKMLGSKKEKIVRPILLAFLVMCVAGVVVGVLAGSLFIAIGVIGGAMAGIGGVTVYAYYFV